MGILGQAESLSHAQMDSGVGRESTEMTMWKETCLHPSLAKTELFAVRVLMGAQAKLLLAQWSSTECLTVRLAAIVKLALRSAVPKAIFAHYQTSKSHRSASLVFTQRTKAV